MEKIDSTVKNLTVRCLSEVSWRDNGTMRIDIREAGGLGTDQYEVQWTEGNAAGVLNLLTFVDGSGATRRILVDVGWDESYTREVLQREGVDLLLSEGKVDLIYVTHEHVDHFFGLGAALSYNRNVKLALPEGFTQKGLERVRDTGHEGELLILPAGERSELFPGLFSYTFPVSIFLKVKNEQVLYADMEGKGVVTITGCCHPGIRELLDVAKALFPGKAIHGVYGGLHICPFDEWGEEQDAIIEDLKGYGVGLFACNHCTGQITVEKMKKAGFNVASGSGRYGSKSLLYPGCGDTVEF